MGFLAASVFSVAYVAAPIHVPQNKRWSGENPWGIWWEYTGYIGGTSRCIINQMMFGSAFVEDVAQAEASFGKMEGILRMPLSRRGVLRIGMHREISHLVGGLDDEHSAPWRQAMVPVGP